MAGVNADTANTRARVFRTHHQVYIHIPRAKQRTTSWASCVHVCVCVSNLRSPFSSGGWRLSRRRHRRRCWHRCSRGWWHLPRLHQRGREGEGERAREKERARAREREREREMCTDLRHWKDTTNKSSSRLVCSCEHVRENKMQSKALFMPCALLCLFASISRSIRCTGGAASRSMLLDMRCAHIKVQMRAYQGA
jgi:hypothetical protein